MKVLGIEISGRDVIIIALEHKEDGIINYTGKYKPLRMEDDEKTENVILFKNTLHAAFDGFSPDMIIIKYRNPKGKGRHAPSPISFKVEGIIQIYEGTPICFTTPQTIAAYYKKNELVLSSEYTYQEDALKLAYHYINTHK